jgi:hypothetical protein
VTRVHLTAPASLWEDPFDRATSWGRYWSVVRPPQAPARPRRPRPPQLHLFLIGLNHEDRAAQAEQVVLLRSGGVCEWCERAGAEAFHARNPLAGGDPANQLNVCRPCHSWLSRNLIAARHAGWLLLPGSDPERRAFWQARDMGRRDLGIRPCRFLGSDGGVYEARHPHLKSALKRWSGPAATRPSPHDPARYADEAASAI